MKCPVRGRAFEVFEGMVHRVMIQSSRALRGREAYANVYLGEERGVGAREVENQTELRLKALVTGAIKSRSLPVYLSNSTRNSLQIASNCWPPPSRGVSPYSLLWGLEK